MYIFQQFKLFPGFLNDRVFMTGICSSQFSRRKLQNPQPYRDEHICRVSQTDLIIDLLQDQGRIGLRRGHSNMVYQRRRYHHEQGSRHTFS